MRLAAIPPSLVLIAAAAAPVPAFAASDSMRIWGVIPVMCGIEGSYASVSTSEIDIDFAHSCNTTHAIVVQTTPIEGEAWISRGGERLPLSGGYAVFNIPMGHFSGPEQYKIEYPGASAEDLDALAASIQISLQIS